MSADRAKKPIQRLLVVLPTWLGDCVMATPTLRALRQVCAGGRITTLGRLNLRPIVRDLPWVDRRLVVRSTRRDPVSIARRLAKGRFDAVVLLPNSFRWAATVAMAGIPRRIGYERDGRGFLLTDRLLPLRNERGFVPVPTLEYYLGLARYLGATEPTTHMELFTRSEDEAAADALLERAGYAGGPLVLLNPGAQKDVKRWAPRRFAELADRLAEDRDVSIAATGSPAERPVLDAVIAAARRPVLDLATHGLNLVLLKSVLRRADLLVTNDTGTRHIAAAMGTPVVTLFGPTPPEWTEIGFAKERQVIAPDRPGGPPRPRPGRPHRFMEDIPVESVLAAATELLDIHAGHVA